MERALPVMSEQERETNGQPQTWGALLREARQAAGLTQGQLASRSGVAERSISDLERGRASTPRRSTAEMLADALGLAGPARQRLLEPEMMWKPPAVREAASGAPRPRRRRTVPRPLRGREREMGDLLGVIRAGGLATVFGPPGVGRSRLVAEAAARSRRATVRVDFAATGRGEGVLPAVAGALGHGRAAPSAAALAAALAEIAPVVVVLDHLTPSAGVAEEIADLIAASPGLAVLVTAPWPLGLDGEVEVGLAPLPVPARDAEGWWPDERALAANPAVALFVDAASRGAQDGEIPLAAAAEVVVMLDGLPLAIEVAAAETAVMPAAAIPRMLALAGSAMLRTAQAPDGRGDALETAVSASLDPLPPGARYLFRTLGVFRGGFTAEALQEVLAATAGPGRIDDLPSLVRARLVRADDQGRRFAMLEPVRLIAAAWLSTEPRAERVRRTHAEWAAAEAARVGDLVTSPRMTAALADEAAERGNTLAALRWAVAARETTIAARIIAPLARIWEAAGIFPSFVPHLLTIADDACRIEDPALRLTILYFAAYFTLALGNSSGGGRHLDALAAAGADRDDGRGLALLCGSLAPNERPADLIPMLEEARALLDGAGHPFAWVAVFRLGAERSLAGDPDRGRLELEEVRDRLRWWGDEFDLPPVLWQLGRTLTDLGHLPEARAMHADGARLCQRHGFPVALTFAALGWADAAARDADPAVARDGARLLPAAVAAVERAGLSLGPVWSDRVTRAAAVASGRFGPDVVAALMADGREVPLGAVVARVLRDAPDDPDPR